MIMKKKENILLIVGLLILAFVIYLGSTYDKNSVEVTTGQQNAENQESDKSTKSICKLDGLECLYVGCNDYY